MNYYKRHIGDYAAKAGHLTALEHGVYCLILDGYYNREQGPTRAEAIRWGRARTKDEIAAVEAVLAEFFVLDGERYTQRRVEEELANFRVRQETNRKLGAKGGEAKAKRIASESLSETGSEPVANAKPSHKPLATSHEKANNPSGCSSAEADCPHAEIVALYHELLPANPRIKVWNGSRAANLRARWREDAKRQSLDYWRRFFAHVAASAFLTGQVADRNGRAFLPGLDWLVLPNNFAKVIEGKYHERV